MLFYGAKGSKERMEENIKLIFEASAGFIDMDSFRAATMSEYLLKS
jgi:hypothetical protein